MINKVGVIQSIPCESFKFISSELDHAADKEASICMTAVIDGKLKQYSGLEDFEVLYKGDNK